MPRLGVNVSDSYSPLKSASRADRFGRQARDVTPLMARKESSGAVLTHPLFLKAFAWLAIIAALTVLLALWRLYHFAH